MSSILSEQHDLDIDAELQVQIFPKQRPSSLTILLQEWTKCICIAHFDDPQPDFEHSNKVVVRVEDGDVQKFQEIATLQRLGSLTAPHLVPRTFRVGTILGQDGKKLAFSITAHVEGVVLTEVYDSLGAGQRGAIMDELVVAVKSFYDIKLSEMGLVLACEDIPLETFPLYPGTSRNSRIGGPQWGYYHDARSFLESVVKKLETWDSRIAIKQVEDGGLLVETKHASLKYLPPLYISENDLREMESGAVMSFMDLEPRNIIVRAKRGETGGYEVAGIIDWEMAGFFPLGFEQVFKDSQCGCINAYFDWYRMFRDKTKDIISSAGAESAQHALFGIMDLARHSYLAQDKRNFALLFTKKWIEEEKVMLDGMNGWIRDPAKAAEVEPWSEKRHELLEAEVAKELGIPWS